MGPWATRPDYRFVPVLPIEPTCVIQSVPSLVHGLGYADAPSIVAAATDGELRRRTPADTFVSGSAESSTHMTFVRALRRRLSFVVCHLGGICGVHGILHEARCNQNDWDQESFHHRWSLIAWTCRTVPSSVR